jgi:type II secretory pathway pseudopilin PulG
LVIVIAVLGIVAAVAIPRMGGLSTSARQAATRAEMQRLKSAILGSPDERGGARAGFEIDVGYPPGRLADLVVKPDSVPVWNPYLSLGWNGPYVDSAGADYLKDAWDSAYVYNAALRTITSKGSGSDLVLSF